MNDYIYLKNEAQETFLEHGKLLYIAGHWKRNKFVSDDLNFIRQLFLFILFY